MDEMIELFSVINQLEKGALGLFFEMNYFVGCALAGYIRWFIQTFENVNVPKLKSGEVDTEMEARFNHMYAWLYFQYIYIYLSAMIGIGVYVLYSNMDEKASQRMKEAVSSPSKGGEKDFEN